VSDQGKLAKKLIEVALPLPEINDASSYDKMPGIGAHPKGIHHWWARLPLPTARAILFASVVDDPGSHPEKFPSEESQRIERERLFDTIRLLMGKKAHEHEDVYAVALSEMMKHCGDQLPTVFDPFSGGGSIPLEANRLGFDVRAGDLNPIPVLLNKCNLELAPRWAGRSPINPEESEKIKGATRTLGTYGLAADIRYYGKIIEGRARQSIGHLYPKASVTSGVGDGANVITWLWARTIPSPNPAAKGKDVPLISTFWLSSKKGSETWLHPVVDKQALTYRFDVRTGVPVDRDAISRGTKAGRAQFTCILTGSPIEDAYIKEVANRQGFGFKLLAMVAEASRHRIFVPADEVNESVVVPYLQDFPNEELVEDSRYLTPPAYGMRTIDKLFTPRQLMVLVTISDLVKAMTPEIMKDAEAAGWGLDAKSYAETVTTFLALALDRCVSFNNTICRWNGGQTVFMFTRPAIPMMWDFSEPNIMGQKAVCWHTAVEICADAVETIAPRTGSQAVVRQLDAAAAANGINNLLVSTDPPYYDNIPYADISDVFYVWLRRTIGHLYPDLFGTMLVPKLRELTASPRRFDGDKEKAKEHFERGFRNAFACLREEMDPRFPLTVYYAFKQSDEEVGSLEDLEDTGTVDLTTGWETLLEALVGSGFQITATWPVRASFKWRVRALGANALASYIVLACRPRATTAPQFDRRSFVAELKRDLPPALRHLQQGNIAPVDFAQAAIGPGMAIFSRYSRVLESSGRSMTVRAALSLINQTLTEVLSEQEDDFDNDTRWAIAWFEQQGFAEGEFGQAELLSKAKVTSISGLQHAGVIAAKGGKVRLLRPEELSADWAPAKERRLSVWEITHHLLRVYFYEKKGDSETADLLRKLGSHGEIARELAYRLFGICEKKKRSQEAQGYNALVLGWPEISRLARDGGTPNVVQEQMFQ
jgi:putative DNA methylase